MTEFDAVAVSDLENQILSVLKEHKDGLSSNLLTQNTPNADNLLRSHVVNKLLSSNVIEMLTANTPTGPSLVLRLRRGTQLENASPEEQLVYSLIEESERKGIWIRDVRMSSGLSDAQLRKVLKVLEQRKLVKAVKAVGTTKKCYILYNLEPDDTLTGGTFYSDQQLDSQFVQTLAQVCINFLQQRRKVAEELNKDNFQAQHEGAFVKSQEVVNYIVEKNICNVNLCLSDIESILNVAVLDGKIEKRLIDNSYRALKLRNRVTPLACIPCIHCTMQNDCKSGHLISPENCKYLKEFFDL